MKMKKVKVMHRCLNCEFSCTSKAALKEHTLSHSAAVQKCTVCSKQFYNARGLKLHMRIHIETNVQDEDFNTSICFMEVGNDRKRYWEQFYEKYEKISDQCTSTVGIDEIDDPTTVRKRVKEHDVVIDELTTISGPSSIEEEEISYEKGLCDSDDEEDKIKDEANQLVDRSVPRHSIVNESHSREHSEHSSFDSPPFAFGEWSDSESDLLFPPGLPSNAKSIFAPTETFKDGLFTPKLSSSKMDSFATPDRETEEHLTCSTCKKKTNYSVVLGLGRSSFQCDKCMLDDEHLDCSEECERCLRIAAQLDARWIRRSIVLNQSCDYGIGNLESEFSIKIALQD